MDQPVSVVVSEAWMEVLEVEKGEPDDDFFALGGHSLLAIELASTLEDRLHIEFPLDVLFFEGTLRSIISACQTLVLSRPERTS